MVILPIHCTWTVCSKSLRKGQSVSDVFQGWSVLNYQQVNSAIAVHLTKSERLGGGHCIRRQSNTQMIRIWHYYHYQRKEERDWTK